jgi:hypothetical protein
MHGDKRQLLVEKAPRYFPSTDFRQLEWIELSVILMSRV